MLKSNDEFSFSLFLQYSSNLYVGDTIGFFFTRFAYQRVNAIIINVRIVHTRNLYSKPENRGSPERPCAMPMVNGLNIAPENPICAAT